MALACLMTGPAWSQSKGLAVFSQAGVENDWRDMKTKHMEKEAGYDIVWTNAVSDPDKQG